MDNPNNVLITKSEVEGILNYFGNIGDDEQYLTIDSLEIFQRAFVHESYFQSVQNAIGNGNMPNENNVYIQYIPTESNERLEYLGDHLLKATMGRYLYERFDGEREGFLTRLKIKIEKCSMLHKIGVTLGFRKYLLLALQVENQTLLDKDRGRGTPSYYEDSFEAFIGAIVVQFGVKGYIYADRFVRNVIENVIDFAEIISHNDNFKDSIQRVFQKWQFKTPVYSNLTEEGPLYRKVFTRMLILTAPQFDELEPANKAQVKAYTHNILADFKVSGEREALMTLLDIVQGGNYILGIGCGRKVVSAEQECAKMCLKNLNLDLDY